MARQINKLHISGNLGSKLPELNKTQDGELVTDFSIANHYSVRDSSQPSGWKDVSDWYNVSCWGALAERVDRDVEAKRLAKGTEVYVEGRIKMRKYTDDKGQERIVAEVTAADYFILQQPAAAVNTNASSSNSNGNAKTDNTTAATSDGNRAASANAGGGSKARANAATVATANKATSSGVAKEEDDYEEANAEDFDLDEEEGGDMPF